MDVFTRKFDSSRLRPTRKVPEAKLVKKNIIFQVTRGWCAQCYPGRAVNLGVFSQLNLPRTVANRTLLVAERYHQR
jgi:hypothetical protein